MGCAALCFDLVMLSGTIRINVWLRQQLLQGQMRCDMQLTFRNGPSAIGCQGKGSGIGNAQAELASLDARVNSRIEAVERQTFRVDLMHTAQRNPSGSGSLMFSPPGRFANWMSGT